MQTTSSNRAQAKVLPSWWQRTFGGSLLKAVTGNFFTDRNNAASLIALMLVYSICTIVVRDQKYEYVDGFSILFSSLSATASAPSARSSRWGTKSPKEPARMPVAAPSLQ